MPNRIAAWNNAWPSSRAPRRHWFHLGFSPRTPAPVRRWRRGRRGAYRSQESRQPDRTAAGFHAPMSALIHMPMANARKFAFQSSTERDLHGARRRLIVTDGVFSMDGDLPRSRNWPNWPAISGDALGRRAHATGVFGRRAGVAEHFGLEDAVHVRVGTLKQALGCIGGFVAGQAVACPVAVNRARPMFFPRPCRPSAPRRQWRL